MVKIVTFKVIIYVTVLHQTWCAVLKERQNEEEEKYRSCETDNQDGVVRSFLWKVKRDPPSYFFGTIHVPYTRVWDHIPENAKVAFRQSENVYFELDLTSPYTMTSLANCQLLPHGENLSNVLPKDIYTRLKEHLEYIREKMPKWITPDQKGKGLYGDYLFDIIAGNWERKRPIWVMLLVNSLTESDIKSREIPVLDLYLAQEAERLGKITGAVEKVKEQCVPLNDLNYSQVLYALNRTLGQHESYRLSNSAIPYTTDDLIHHYNCGDLNDIIFNKDSAQVPPNILNDSVPPSEIKMAEVINEYFQTELINKRNERMADRVAGLLNNNPQESFFFAFGAGHFLGNNTVIDRLRGMGFDIEHTHPDQEIPKLKFYNRNRNKHRNKLHEEFGDLWDQMDEESRLWLEKTRTAKRKKYNSDKPFNDLWIRMETPSPGLIQQVFEESKMYQQQVEPTPEQTGYLYNAASSLTYLSYNFLIVAILFTYHLR
ncbi:metalloprotease TIKI1-like isoform X2 [Ruditapes philippinarum]|uniref:metalloprotease TIKI1-like isoform X2 n=1 Tax=Ruditapes philippinarum TaxID=129788 RepID=UPI00295B1A59|nr:metalloprotease TIKI1-like isoform X2 [Ruditapes philippinarum]